MLLHSWRHNLILMHMAILQIVRFLPAQVRESTTPPVRSGRFLADALAYRARLCRRC